MKKFSQEVIAKDESALETVREYLCDHMRQLGYAPIAGTETYSGLAPNYKVTVLGEQHNDAETVNYLMGGGQVEWLPVKR